MKKYNLYRIIVLCIGILFCFSANAQVITTAGQKFRLAFGGNSKNEIGTLSLRLVATEPCNYSITFRGDPYDSYTITGSLTANELIKTISLSSVYNSFVANPSTDSGKKTSKSALITATEDISVYALSWNSNSADAAAVFPVSSYGTEYYQISSEPYDSGSGVDKDMDGFLVVGEEDGTEVWVNDVKVEELYAGQVWVQYDVNDLTGTHVKTSKPAAFFQVNTGTRIPYGEGGTETTYEQFAAVENWGKEFFVPVTHRKSEIVKVFAAKDGTVVTYNSETVTLNSGESMVRTNTGGAYITCTHPVGVVTFMVAAINGIGDPATAWVPAIDQMLTEPVAIAAFPSTTASATYYAQLVVKKGTESNTEVRIGNGSYTAITSGWTTVGDYSFQNYRLTNSSAVYRFVNPDGLLMWGYETASYESYHYLVGTGFRRLDNQLRINGFSSETINGKQLSTCKGLLLEAVLESSVNESSNYLLWYIDGVLQTNKTNIRSWTTNSLSAGHHTIKMVAIPLTGADIEIEVELEITTGDFIWTGAAGDSNWNNPDNWIWANGTIPAGVPESCSKVFIPGGLSTYPCLEESIYQSGDCTDDPVCDELTLHFGGELAWPHKLIYNKAFVEYNYGYYKNLNSVSYGASPGYNRDNDSYQSLISSYSAPVLKRNKYYSLSSPLKSVAAGDFAFGGYPMSYAFVWGKPDHDDLSEFPANGNLYEFNLPGILLEDIRNTAMISVNGYKNASGAKDHTNLEGLKGVVQLPYFENEAVTSYYPHHAYSPIAGESYMYYYDLSNFQLVYGIWDVVKRTDEAYRFIFENDNNTPGTISSGGTVVGYQLTTRSSETHFFLGNPFPASINSQRFYNANLQYLDASKTSYTLYNDDLSAGEVTYSYSTSNHIPPYSGFGVYIKSTYTNTNIPWKFPLEGTNALTGKNYRGVFPLSLSNAMKVTINPSGEPVSDRAILAPSSLYGASLEKYQFPVMDAQPEVFFISPDNGKRHLLQLLEKGVEQITIGVRCSDTEIPLQLTFDGMEEVANETDMLLILEDRRLGVRQDIKADPVYRFYQQGGNEDNSYMDNDRFVLHLLSTNDVRQITINYANGYFNVYSVNGISRIAVYDLLGHKLEEKRGFSENDEFYSAPLSLNRGIYLISVKDRLGREVTEKVLLP